MFEVLMPIDDDAERARAVDGMTDLVLTLWADAGPDEADELLAALLDATAQE